MRQESTSRAADLLRGIRGQRGITFLELTVALIIIAILVTIAVPVLLNFRHKADRVTAEANLRIGGQCLDRLWFQMLDRDEKGDGVDSYKDFGPPPELMTAEYETLGYVSVDARYMSFYETRIKWADLEVGGDSPPIAASDLSTLSLTTDYGFAIKGIYQNAIPIQQGTEIERDWSILPGKIGVVQNKYYWDGGWQANFDNYYVTLLTLEPSGITHYLTVKQGRIADYGKFEWDDGSGDPGDGWKDDEKPPDDPEDGDDPGDKPPPGDEPPPGDKPPPGDEPPPPEPPIASLSIEPEVINLKSAGDFTIFIEMGLSPGYSVFDLDPLSIVTYGAAAQDFTIASDFRVVTKFDRRELTGVPVGENVQFEVSGNFKDGTPFVGYGTVTIISPP